MKTLCFSTYLTAIKAALKESVADPDLIELLFAAVIQPTALLNKHGDPYIVDKTMASKLVNQTLEIPKNISTASSDLRVAASIYPYFAQAVTPKMAVRLIGDCILNLSEMIKLDVSIDESNKTALCAKATVEQFSEFVADTFLYVLQRRNNKRAKQKSTEQQQLVDKTAPDQQRFPPLTIQTPPDDVAPSEMPYVSELLAAYGDAEGVDDFTRTTLQQYKGKYEDHFNRQRKDFYAAESVRRGTQEAYGDAATDQFSVLEEETYDGIIDVWEQDYANGYIRLKNVLIQAPTIQIDRCWLCRDTDWIGNSQKKGVCHVLVNDGKLKGWVKK